MGWIKKIEKIVGVLMTLILVMMAVPVPAVTAAMVGTKAVLSDHDNGNARDRLRSFLDRQDVQRLLTARGIDPVEAEARIDSLSDAEARRLAGSIDQLPAGGDAGGTALYLAIIAFLVLVILELLGYTDFI